QWLTVSVPKISVKRLQMLDLPSPALPSFALNETPDSNSMPAVQFIVEGGHTLSGTIRPSGNKNAALPIIAAALLTDRPVTLENVPRIRDVETLVELVRTVGVEAEWTGRNTLAMHAKELRAGELDRDLCAR